MLFYVFLFIYVSSYLWSPYYVAGATYVSPLGTRSQKYESADPVFRELIVQAQRTVEEQLNTESLVPGWSETGKSEEMAWG